MAEDKKIKLAIEVGSEFAKPSDRLVVGDRRLVRYLPFSVVPNDPRPLMLPAIWISPYAIDDKDIGRAKFAILLLDKGPPKPEIVAVRIPEAAISKFPMGPVEW